MANIMRRFLQKFRSRIATLEERAALAAGHAQMSSFAISDFSDRSLQLQGRMASRLQPKNSMIRHLGDVEFRAYSQWGEDGIIEWLCSHLDGIDNRFVEFGVETFREANCRFLMHNRNWKGLVIDGSAQNIESLKSQACFWMYDLTAVASFVTAENISQLIEQAGFSGEIGILSIDVDGNDYWIWKAIDNVKPAIAICEYNPIFGDKRAITVPYDPAFTRFKKHFSGLCFGASIKAIQKCAKDKGYTFVGTNTNGINAFFVRDDLAGPIVKLLEEVRAWPSRHRDSRDVNGQLSFVGGMGRLSLIGDCSVIDVESGEELLVRDMDDLYSDEWRATA